MEEMNEMTMVTESPVVMNNESEPAANADVQYVDAGVVFAGGAVAGILVWECTHLIWNCKFVKKGRNYVATQLEKICHGIKVNDKTDRDQTIIMEENNEIPE